MVHQRVAFASFRSVHHGVSKGAVDQFNSIRKRHGRNQGQLFQVVNASHLRPDQALEAENLFCDNRQALFVLTHVLTQ